MCIMSLRSNCVVCCFLPFVFVVFVAGSLEECDGAVQLGGRRATCVEAVRRGVG